MTKYLITFHSVLLFLKKKKVPECITTQNSVRGVLYRCHEKKVPECCSGLRPSEKGHPEWRSGTKIPHDFITLMNLWREGGYY